MKYITDFQQTGISTLNVDLVCKDWNDRCSIVTWINDNEEEYTFIVNSKRKKTRLQTGISKEQAIDIANRLKLVLVKGGPFRSGGAYHTEKFVLSEIERIREIKEIKEQELLSINRILCDCRKSLQSRR